MGCCSSADEPYDPTKRDEKLARRLQQQELQHQDVRLPVPPRAPRATLLGAQHQQRRDWGAAGPGYSLDEKQVAGADASGDFGVQGAAQSAEERRQRAIEAAERRQVPEANVSEARAAALRERRLKDDLLGKLAEHYARKREEMPMGLNAASVQQLKRHWESVRSDLAY
mmetsp:Transcript_29658/g.75505  ORF Transcript_29658/g.75505 Transcript_29658/m.75505 type:complete len:169 (-) Transcript_29658:92-598(-)